MKTTEFITKQTIHDLDLYSNEREVKILMAGIWSEFFKKMKGLDEKTIFLRGIGVFPLSRFKLCKLIKRLIKDIRKKERNGKDSSEARAKLKTAILRRNEIAWNYYNQRIKTLKSVSKRLVNSSKERPEEW